MSKLSKWLKKQGKSVEKWVSNHVPHQHSSERRAANQAVAEQISYYQQAKEEMASENKRVDDERNQEKKKIAQKQIRSMRRSYRAPGFMDEANPGLSDTLG